MGEFSTEAVGMDIGDKYSCVTLRDKSGEVSERTKLGSTRKGIERYFSRLERCRVAIEVGTHSPWMSRLLSELGHEVYVANARKLRAIWDSVKKTDEGDADLLSEIVQIKPELLRPIQHCSDKSRNTRAVLRARDALLRARTQLVNHVRGSVKPTGARMPSGGADSFHQHIDALPEELRPALEPLVTQIGQLTTQIKAYDREIERLGREEYPETQILQQISGVGPITSLAFVTTVEDPGRFPRARMVGSYLGLVPRLDSSGQKNPQLRITKAGDQFVRRLLVGCAQYILGPFGPDTDLRRWGLALCERGGKNAKKRATVALARKLAVLLLRLWRTKGTYEPLRQAERLASATPGESGPTSVSASDPVVP